MIECEPIHPRSKTISLVAYCALPPNLVFLRVPNERGRWMITERCCVEIECPLCHSPAGEPCISRPGNYVNTIHFWRRNAWRSMGKPGNNVQHKPRLSTQDIPQPLYPDAPCP